MWRPVSGVALCAAVPFIVCCVAPPVSVEDAARDVVPARTRLLGPFPVWVWDVCAAGLAACATAVGATAVGPSLTTLKDYPQLADRAIAQGRAVYCWNVDDYEDIDFCRDVGVAWLATHHPGRTKAWLQGNRAGEGSG